MQDTGVAKIKISVLILPQPPIKGVIGFLIIFQCLFVLMHYQFMLGTSAQTRFIYIIIIILLQSIIIISLFQCKFFPILGNCERLRGT